MTDQHTLASFVSVRIEAEQRARLKALARSNHRSMGGEIRCAIDEHIAKQPEPNGDDTPVAA